MPTFQSCDAPTFADGTGHSITGTGVYTLNCWSGGQYRNMWSAFSAGAPTATGVLKHRNTNLNLPGSVDFANEHIIVVNQTGAFNAMTWGMDLNFVDAGQQEQLLVDSVNYLLFQ